MSDYITCDTCPYCGEELLGVFNNMVSSEPEEFEYDCECGRTLNVKVFWSPTYAIKDEVSNA